MEVDHDNSKPKVALTYRMPKNNLSTWLKNKERIFDVLKKRSNSKRQRLSEGLFVILDQAIFR